MTLKLIIVCFSPMIQIATLHADDEYFSPTTLEQVKQEWKEITAEQRQAIKTIDFHLPLLSTRWHFSSVAGGVCKHKM